MIIKNTPFKRVTIIGVGLMGGSLGLALKKRGLAREVVGLAYRQSSLVQAIKNKAIDVAFTDPQKAVRNSDMVILAAPVDSIIKILPTIAPHIKRGCVVTDVGSTKSEIVETGEKVLPVPGFFVGAHPLVGSEKKGADYSSADLFEGGTCIMTPTEATNQIAKEKVKYIPLQAKEGDLAIFLRKEAFEIEFEKEKLLIVPQSSVLLLIRNDFLDMI